MARAREAGERGSKPRGAARATSENGPEETQPEKADAPEIDQSAAVAPEVAAIIEALIAPQQTQPDRVAEVGPQQDPSLIANVSGALASFEAPVPALVNAQLAVVVPETASEAATVVEPALETEGVAIDGLETVQPEVLEAPPTDATEPQVAGVSAGGDDSSDAAAPRGATDAAVEAIGLEAAPEDGDVVAGGRTQVLDSEDGPPTGRENNTTLLDTGIDLAAPRGAGAPALNITEPVDATAATSVGRSTEMTATQPAVEVEAVARPVDTSNAPQLASRLADTVQAAVRTGDNSIRLVLSPPDLGHLDVRVVERADGVTVTLAAESSDARDLLQQHLPVLRAALEARDVRVDRLDVTQGSSTAGLGAANDQARGRRDQQEDERPDWSMAAALDGAAAGVGTPRGQSATRLVDVRA